jgi:hypothetical protein
MLAAGLCYVGGGQCRLGGAQERRHHAAMAAGRARLAALRERAALSPQRLQRQVASAKQAWELDIVQASRAMVRRPLRPFRLPF